MQLSLYSLLQKFNWPRLDTYFELRQASVELIERRLASTPQHAAMKKRKQDADCAAKGWVCVPLAMCTLGAWCAEGETAVVRLAEHVADRTGVAKSVAACSRVILSHTRFGCTTMPSEATRRWVCVAADVVGASADARWLGVRVVGDRGVVGTS